FIDNIEDNSIIISNNKEVLNSIFSSYEIFDKEIDKHSIRNLTIHSLFELSFSYKNRFYNRIKIAALYIKSLINCLEFFKDYDIDLTKLNRFKNLKAIFLDKNLNIVDFGKSDKFLISQNNLDLVEFEIKFIKEYYKYAKAIFITNSYLDYLNKDEQIIIKNIEDLKNILDNIEFNSIYLVGFDYLTVLDYFSKPKNLPTLF
ncbi:MAG TPA: peptidoglycan synthetase, partial [Aliarcobacter thereius]|nr:peptidoglycan synthetase [Aliarcobacter thereius]